MADHIEDNNAFFVGAPAWHGKGQVLQTPPSVSEAAKLAYPYPLIALVPEIPVIAADGTRHAIPSETCKIVMRAHPDPTKRELGHVGADYELLQPAEHFEIFDSLVSDGLVDLESGFSLYEGKALAVCAKVRGAEQEIIKGDPVNGYVTFSAGFTGNLKGQMARTNTRVVCHNTLTIAMVEAWLAEQQGKKARKAGGRHVQEYWAFKHTKNVRQRINDATDTIAAVLRGFNDDVAAYKQLAAKKTTRQAQEHYIRRVIIGPEVELPLREQEISTQMENKAVEVIGLLDTQKGLELVPAARGTAWQAYNAVTHYLTHDYGKTEQTRLEANMFGKARDINREALKLAVTTL